MRASYIWNNSLTEVQTFSTGSLEFFPNTFPVFAPKSLQRFTVRVWVVAAFGVSGSGPQQFPVPGEWTIAVYATDTAGFLRSYANEGWMESLTGWADADVGGWNTVGTFTGPYPVFIDIQARKAAPPGPGGELDLHIDLTFQPHAELWTAQHFQVQRTAWLDVNWLTSEPSA